MSSINKSQASHNQFFCEVCKTNIHSEAEYALHEFSKKHCDNLLRIAKNKPIVRKQKAVKTETPAVVKEQPKVNITTTPGNFAKYGYFIPGEIYDTANDPKEFNTEYDPYLQKFAENPMKEVSKTEVKPAELPQLQTGNVASFRRKKKKKIRTCQICNATLLTVPEYEAHMRSAQHLWKLKTSGMGVSAHFVKASSDLHTIEAKDNAFSEIQSCEITENSTPPMNGEIGSTSTTSVFPTLYCDICHILLNSEQQFNAHVNGKSHNDNVQRKVEMKAKRLQTEIPSPNQLYCFSCKLSLNNLYQYNEHKFGKKHKLKCRRLMKDGITIPPEERVASWPTPKLDPNKPVIYPELYEKFLLDKQIKNCDHNEQQTGECSTNSCEIPKLVSEPLVCSVEKVCDQSIEPNALNDDTSRMVFQYNKDEKLYRDEPAQKESDRNQEGNNEWKVKILDTGDVLKCSICSEDFVDHPQFDVHVGAEGHARKILELKMAGTSESDILASLLRDKSYVKPDRYGRYSCSVCSVTTGNTAELHRHMSSVVHKQSQEDYRKKRGIEIKSAVNPDDNGAFTCGSCKEIAGSLVEFNQHLHSVKHRDALNAEKAKKMMNKKRALLLQQRRVKHKYIISGLKRKDFACWRKKCEKNPGVRTKITGMAIDLNTGAKARIPNLETLEPKIDSVQNVTIGATDKVEEPIEAKRESRSNHWNQQKHYRPVIKPLMPRFPVRSQSRHHRPGIRHWSPYPPIHHFRNNNFPPHFPFNRYHRPQNYPQWPRYPPCYQ